jgi:aldehyde dehydrogenase (NAD+)
MRGYTRHYIDGAWIESDSGDPHKVINPATEAPVTEITLGSAADVDKAVAAAKRAFESFSHTTVDERIALIERILEAYKARTADMAEAISLEMGAPLSLAKTAQVGSGIGHLMSA